MTDTRPNYYRVKLRDGREVECFDLIEALGFDESFNLGNVLKYLWRAGRKTPDALADLQKAARYLEREIEKRGGEVAIHAMPAPDGLPVEQKQGYELRIADMQAEIERARRAEAAADAQLDDVRAVRDRAEAALEIARKALITTNQERDEARTSRDAIAARLDEVVRERDSYAALIRKHNLAARGLLGALDASKDVATCDFGAERVALEEVVGAEPASLAGSFVDELRAELASRSFVWTISDHGAGWVTLYDSVSDVRRGFGVAADFIYEHEGEGRRCPCTLATRAQVLVDMLLEAPSAVTLGHEPDGSGGPSPADRDDGGAAVATPHNGDGGPPKDPAPLDGGFIISRVNSAGGRRRVFWNRIADEWLPFDSPKGVTRFATLEAAEAAKPNKSKVIAACDLSRVLEEDAAWTPKSKTKPEEPPNAAVVPQETAP